MVGKGLNISQGKKGLKISTSLLCVCMRARVTDVTSHARLRENTREDCDVVN